MGIGFILVSRFIEANYVDVTVTSDTWGKFYNLSAYVEYGFFIVGLVMSGAALIYHICRIGKSKEGRVNPDDDEDEESELSEIENELMREDLKDKDVDKKKRAFIDLEGEDSGYSTDYMRNDSKRKMKESAGYF